MSTSKVLLGVCVGLAAGVVLGVLLAPEEGDETRKKLTSTGRKIFADLKSEFDTFLDDFLSEAESEKDV